MKKMRCGFFISVQYRVSVSVPCYLSNKQARVRRVLWAQAIHGRHGRVLCQAAGEGLESLGQFVGAAGLVDRSRAFLRHARHAPLDQSLLAAGSQRAAARETLGKVRGSVPDGYALVVHVGVEGRAGRRGAAGLVLVVRLPRVKRGVPVVKCALFDLDERVRVEVPFSERNRIDESTKKGHPDARAAHRPRHPGRWPQTGGQ